jgi:hypothetical protein
MPLDLIFCIMIKGKKKVKKERTKRGCGERQ